MAATSNQLAATLFDTVERELAAFGLEVEAEALRILKANGTDLTGRLRQSLTSRAERAASGLVRLVVQASATDRGFPYPDAVNFGQKPHWGPIAPLIRWAKLRFRRSDPRETYRIARGKQIAIAERGTEGTGFLSRPWEALVPTLGARLAEAITDDLRAA